MKELIVVMMIAVITFVLRAFPFLLFSGQKELPPLMVKLEKQLPQAVMILLVIYCLRSISFVEVSNWIPQCCGVIVTALVHLKQKNVLLSILSGTLCTMFLIQVVF